MFLDEAKIQISGGAGGNGCVGWRREKYVPKGGPDGGDGGRGGNVIVRADSNTDTLSDFRSKKRFAAENGKAGSGQNKHGRDGEDLILLVPPGTVITQDTTQLADLREHGDEYIAAKGGRGGYGNAHFKSSTRQRPDFAEKGEPGETHQVLLELKLVADAGIIGYPSVGKSTLISVISSAKPKIADYPFTTLIPNLGVVDFHDRSFIVCDIPGLIEGASEGKGLGDTFLKHIERCGVLVHLLDVSRALEDGTADPKKLINDYKAIRKELKAYSPALEKKREIVVLNKMDLISAEEVSELISALKKKKVNVVLAISAATVQGTQDLVKLLLPIVIEERQSRLDAEENTPKNVAVLTPHLETNQMGSYKIEKKADGTVVVKGKRLEQFVKMTNFDSEGAVQRFRDVLDKIGLKKALKRERESDTTPVFIGAVRVDEYL